MYKTYIYTFALLLSLLFTSCATQVNNTKQDEAEVDTVMESTASGELLPETSTYNSKKQLQDIFKKIPLNSFSDSSFNFCVKERTDMCAFETLSLHGETVQCENYILDSHVSKCTSFTGSTFIIWWWEWKSSAFVFWDLFKSKQAYLFSYPEFPTCFEEKIDVCIEEASYRNGGNFSCDSYIWEDKKEECIQNQKNGSVENVSECENEQCKYDVVMRQAYESNDENTCNSLSSNFKDECINNIVFLKAIDAKSSRICDKMVESSGAALSYTKEFCKSEVLFLWGE